MSVNNNPPYSGPTLRPRNARGTVAGSENRPPSPALTRAHRPVSPDLLYSRVVEPVIPNQPAVVPNNGGETVSTPREEESAARFTTEMTPALTSSVDFSPEYQAGLEGWTPVTAKTARTHRTQAGARSVRRPASMGDIHVDYVHNTVDPRHLTVNVPFSSPSGDATSPEVLAEEGMSANELRALARRYKQLAKMAEDRTTPQEERSAPPTATEKGQERGIPMFRPLPESGSEAREPAYPEQTAKSGPSTDKGKGPDPRNWAAAGLSESDFSEDEIELQREALENYRVARERRDRRAGQDAEYTPPMVSPKKESQLSDDDAESNGEGQVPDARFERELQRLSDRISELELVPSPGPPARATRAPSGAKPWPREPDGVKETLFSSVLRGMSRTPRPTGRNGGHPDDSDDSSSSESDSDVSRAGADSDEDSDASTAGSTDPDNRWRSPKRRTKRVTSTKMVVKPNPPCRYDGSEDAEKYAQFVDEAERYCRLGKIPKGDQVAMIGYYLDGEARDYYNRRVRGKEGKWDLKKLLTSLLKYCFLPDFRLRQRKKLNRCFQNGKSVNKHVLEFESLLLLIGAPKDQERVAVLWQSFNEEIQKELYRLELDPETSNWKKVVRTAERVERFLSIESNQKRRGQTQPTTQDSQTARQKQRFPPKRFRAAMRAAAAEVVTPKKTNDSRPRSGRGDPERPAERPWERALSPQKKKDLMSKGLCLNCEEQGHMARNCPKLTSMKSDTKGRPPGLRSHAVGLASSSLQDTTEVLESFSIGVASSEAEEKTLEGEGRELETLPDEDDLSDLSERLAGMTLDPCLVGDLAAQFAALALECCQPFPGDDKPPGPPVTGSIYVEQCTVPSEYLLDPKFRIGAYWAQKCLAELGQDDEMLLKSEPFAVELGDAPLAMALIKLEEMEQGSKVAGLESSFSVSDCVNGKYKIRHLAHGACAELRREHLLDPTFDLSAWRRNWLQEARQQQQGTAMGPLQSRPKDDRLGDLLAEGAVDHLRFGAPYPGDDRARGEAADAEAVRFSAHTVGENCVIHDRLHKATVYVSTHHLLTPTFELAGWYAAMLRERFDLGEGKRTERYRARLGDLLAAGTLKYFRRMRALDP
ncbi:unnamed protein product, partial [Mycena citricolor]